MSNFMPTLAELYTGNRGLMIDRKSDKGAFSARGRHALEAYQDAKHSLVNWHMAFPDTVDENKLALFKRAQQLTGAKLYAAMPSWVKTHLRNHAAPKSYVFIPDQPPKFPAWTHTPRLIGYDMRWNRGNEVSADTAPPGKPLVIEIPCFTERRLAA